MIVQSGLPERYHTRHVLWVFFRPRGYCAFKTHGELSTLDQVMISPLKSVRPYIVSTIRRINPVHVLLRDSHDVFVLHGITSLDMHCHVYDQD